jgi:uncharacterized protein YdaT
MSALGISPLKQNEDAMPWSGKSFASHHNHSLSGAAASKAASMANAILRSGASEGVAIATANKRVGQMRKRGRISNKAHERMESRSKERAEERSPHRSAGLDSMPDVDAATA